MQAHIRSWCPGPGACACGGERWRSGAEVARMPSLSGAIRALLRDTGGGRFPPQSPGPHSSFKHLGPSQAQRSRLSSAHTYNRLLAALGTVSKQE